MPRRRASSPRPASSRAQQATVRNAAGRLSGGKLLSFVLLIALWTGNVFLARSLWLSLPGNCRARLDADALRAAFAAARPNYPPEAREALLLWLNSERLTESFRHPDRTAELLASVRDTLPGLRRSQLGRLQVAALTLREAEVRGVPPDAWWPRVKPFLMGLDAATFPHLLTDLLMAEADVYGRLGLRDACAYGAAREILDAAHGPFLQYLTDRLERLAAALEGNDAEAAAVCRRLTQRLLRQWVADVGPPGLRLLAADLLARTLETARPRAPLSDTVAAECRAWREACRTRAETAPPVPGLLKLSDDTAGNADIVLNTLVVLVWTAAAGLAAAGVAVLTAPLWLRSHSGGWGWLIPAAGLLALVVWGAGYGVATFSDELVTRDARRLEQPELGLPRLPMLAGAVGVMAAGLFALPGLIRRRSWRARGETLGRNAVVLSLWLGVVTAAGQVAPRVLLAKYERQFAPDRWGGWLRPAPWEAQKLLECLRVWNP